MPTVAAYNLVTTTDVEQVLNVRGANNIEITIAGAAISLRLAYRQSGVTGGLGIAETHPPKILNIENEPIDQVSVKSAKVGSPATVTVIGST